MSYLPEEKTLHNNSNTHNSKQESGHHPQCFIHFTCKNILMSTSIVDRTALFTTIRGFGQVWTKDLTMYDIFFRMKINSLPSHNPTDNYSLTFFLSLGTSMKINVV